LRSSSDGDFGEKRRSCGHGQKIPAVAAPKSGPGQS
jgi:hypothetical protein